MAVAADMSEKLLSDFLTNRLEEGQKKFAGLIRALVGNARPDLLTLVDVNDITTFLEPLLFAYFNTPNSPVSLDQILYGYIEVGRRPRLLKVIADERGAIYLPNIGYFETSHSQGNMEIVWDGHPRICRYGKPDSPIDFIFKPVQKVADASIEICGSMPPLLQHLFQDEHDNPLEVEVQLMTKRRTLALLKAFQLIKMISPRYYEDLRKVTRKIVIYNGKRPYSFASVSAHGIAFLNVNETNDEVFFLEDLIHQCGHIIFSAITFQKEDFLQVAPETPLSEFTHDDDDNTPIYGAFHGLFTQSNINRCLLDCYKANVFSGRQLHELLGRLSDDMKRFKSALYLLAHREIYTELGWTIFHEFKRRFEELERESQPLVSRFDTSNQPYIFNYERFEELNPLSRMQEMLN